VVVIGVVVDRIVAGIGLVGELGQPVDRPISGKRGARIVANADRAPAIATEPMQARSDQLGFSSNRICLASSPASRSASV
jgi:hypothetical protein